MQYVYTMIRAGKIVPPKKEILRDISLSFFPGAKIGVLGYNGAGKSTLLRIMAGQDKEFRGEAQLAPGATVGLLEQEPQLDESKDVRGNVEDGVAELRGLLDRFNELAANYSDETADEFARLQEKIDAADAWNLDVQLDQAMDALRLPPGDADVTRLSGGERRRVALCRLLLSALGEEAESAAVWVEREAAARRAGLERESAEEAMRELVARDLVLASGGGFKVRVDLFRLWLRRERPLGRSRAEAAKRP